MLSPCIGHWKELAVPRWARARVQPHDDTPGNNTWAMWPALSLPVEPSRACWHTCEGRHRCEGAKPSGVNAHKRGEAPLVMGAAFATAKGTAAVESADGVDKAVAAAPEKLRPVVCGRVEGTCPKGLYVAKPKTGLTHRYERASERVSKKNLSEIGNGATERRALTSGLQTDDTSESWHEVNTSICSRGFWGAQDLAQGDFPLRL